jgi:hypothetical protein
MGETPCCREAKEKYRRKDGLEVTRYLSLLLLSADPRQNKIPVAQYILVVGDNLGLLQI